MNRPAKQCQLDTILMSDPQPVILENWTSDVRRDGLYLEGEVHGHPTIANGTTIRTARVTWMLHDVGIAQTQTINYILYNRR
jgi:hypothetical protein